MYHKIKRSVCNFFVTVSLFFSTISSQTLLNKSFFYNQDNTMFDSGENFDELTFVSFNWYKQITNSSKKFRTIEKKIGLYNAGSSLKLSHRYSNIFENKIYSFIESNIMTFKDNFNNEKNDLVVFDIVNSGVGYKNNWLLLQIGRGNENWGAGEDINLALSDNSKPYEYFLLQSDYGKIRVGYIHGFLEQIDSGISRYITSRGVEWTNKKSLLVGLSETVIYSGMNRSIDLAYFNPISTHLEVELNNRLNVYGSSNSNAVWQFHGDYIKGRSRFSLNYLIDEFVLDPDIEKSKEHGKAYSFRYCFSAIKVKNHILNLTLRSVLIGTPTFRHINGMNNFINNNKPIGWKYGSDGKMFGITMSYLNIDNLLFNLSYDLLKVGEESITDRYYEPYADYQKGKYPSGLVVQRKIIQIELIYRYINSIEFYVKNEIEKKNHILKFGCVYFMNFD